MKQAATCESPACIEPDAGPAPISVPALIRRFWRAVLPTWVLVVLEGVSLVAMPMAIGWAVDDLMAGEFDGVFQLAGLCVVLLIVGAGRRFYDTRAYGRIYRTVAPETVEREWKRDAPLTKASARTNLLSEFIDFLEESIPDLLQQLISVVGALLIILMIDWRVFVACLGTVMVAAFVYLLSNGKIYRLNQGQNDEFERQVDAISGRDRERLRDHLSRFTNWRIRLSDLETLNFSLIWILLGGLLIYTVVTVSTGDNSSFGQVVASVMYVFGFIEALIAFPLYYQQLVRLREIATRLGNSGHTQELNQQSYA